MSWHSDSPQRVLRELSARKMGRVRLLLTTNYGLLTTPKTRQRNIIMLATAGGVDFDRFDDALAQRARGEGAALESVVNSLDVELHVLDVHGIGDAVGKNENAIARRQLDLARGILEPIHHTQGQADNIFRRR